MTSLLGPRPLLTTLPVPALPEFGTRSAARSWPKLLWQEARPIVQLTFGLRFLCGALLAAQGPLIGKPMVALAAWVLLATAVYVVNGVSDVAGDRCNGSRRPLASGRLPVPVAVAGVVITGAVGLLALCWVDLTVAVLGAAFLAAGVAYSIGRFALKNHWASASLCCMVGGALTYLAGVVAVHGTPSDGQLLVVLAASAWMGIGGATTKDFDDIDGDRAAGRRTVPVVVGRAAAERIVAIGNVAFALAVAAVGLALHAPLPPLLTLSVGALCVGVVAAARRSDARGPYRVFVRTQLTTSCMLLLGSIT